MDMTGLVQMTELSPIFVGAARPTRYCIHLHPLPENRPIGYL